MFKKLFCFFFILLLMCTPFSSFAEGEASAFLSDVSTDKNRIFETTLSVNISVSAFVATLEFDEEKVEFRSAKALFESSEISVNNSENGKVILAYVNEHGTDGEILSFTFKAKTENAYISLSLEQVIDKKGNDIILKNVKGADIKITAKAVSKNEGNKENAEYKEKETSALSESKDSLTLNIPAKETKTSQKIIFVSLGTAMLAGVGTLGFILGRNSDNKNKNRKNNYEKNS